MREKSDIAVLVVDDLSLARHLLKTSLNKLGVTQVLEATDGLQATRTLKESHLAGRRIDLILCDINMPHMNGLEFLKQIRSEPLYQQIPFIAVTVESNPSLIAVILREGATDFMIKPLQSLLVERKLADLLTLIARK